jgi:hypothetical protein
MYICVSFFLYDALRPQESISKYVNDVTDSDVVLAYFVTECGR